MDDFEIPSLFPGLRNFRVPIPGADAVAFLGKFDPSGVSIWNYSLWSGENEGTLISTGSLDLTGMDGSGIEPGPEQVARIAFLLDVDYATDDTDA